MTRSHKPNARNARPSLPAHQKAGISREDLLAELDAACRWLADVARVKNEKDVTPEDRKRHPLKSWAGAIRGEYSPRDRTWSFFCPLWHSGQAAKGLVMASEFVGARALAAAESIGKFVLANQVAAGDDKGMLLGFEDFSHAVNTSAVLETLDGLFFLAEKTGESAYADAALGALRWVAGRAWLPGQGGFRDLYDPRERKFITGRHWDKARPLLDDGAFITGYRLTGEKRFLDIAVETADRLLADEEPSGNWLRYAPCLRQTGSIHPRQAYWWARPLRMLWDETSDARYLFAFQRSVEWYRRALRSDGGLFRDTRTDFRTASFNQTTSASACACLLFLDALECGHPSGLRDDIDLSLSFCRRMQVRSGDDPQLRGALVEGVRQPDGTGANPLYVRDLATIFFVQAASAWLHHFPG